MLTDVDISVTWIIFTEYFYLDSPAYRLAHTDRSLPDLGLVPQSHFYTAAEHQMRKNHTDPCCPDVLHLLHMTG